MRELKELKLPQMLEARTKEASPVQDSPTLGHSHQLSQSSTMSDFPSPTFSSHGNSRMQSSTSSMPSSPNMVDSETFGSAKRPLTEVKEEPLEKDDDYEMIETFRQEEEHKDTNPQDRLSQYEWSLDDPEVLRMIEYNLKDGPSSDCEYLRNPHAKRQRPDLSPLVGLTSKMSSRMPSLSRKWKSRKASPSISNPPLSREPSMSRANSTRAHSITSAHGTIPPPTPPLSVRPDSGDNGFGSFSSVHERGLEVEGAMEDQAKPSTPLLPPLMTEHISHVNEEPCQSPLQSPSVADPAASSAINSPSDIPQTPQVPGLPSPPLSTKPSIASFHHRHYGNPPLIPSSEIPPMHIGEPPQDEWADSLGHANFTIQPAPYIPIEVSLESCKILRNDWDTARKNYAKHLLRVEEHAGPTSRIFALTEEKWAAIDKTWKSNVDACVAQLNDMPLNMPDAPANVEPVGRDLAKTPPMVKIPALNGLHTEGKFPHLGDEGIVGPMEVGPLRVEVIEQQEKENATKRKRKLGHYIKDWLLGVGMFGSNRAQ